MVSNATRGHEPLSYLRMTREEISRRRFFGRRPVYGAVGDLP